MGLQNYHTLGLTVQDVLCWVAHKLGSSSNEITARVPPCLPRNTVACPGPAKSRHRQQARSRLSSAIFPRAQRCDRASQAPAKSTNATSSQLSFRVPCRWFSFLKSSLGSILSRIIFRPHTSNRLQFKCVWYETWKLNIWDVATCVVMYFYVQKKENLFLSRSRCMFLIVIGNPLFPRETTNECGRWNARLLTTALHKQAGCTLAKDDIIEKPNEGLKTFENAPPLFSQLFLTTLLC